MPDKYRSGDKLHDISAINSSLADLEQEKHQVIYRHLAGQQVVGLYPLLQDSTCHLLAADFDKGNWQD